VTEPASVTGATPGGGEATRLPARGSNRAAMDPRPGWIARAALTTAAALIAACTASEEDVRPPELSLFFPTGLVASPDQSLLFVVSANSDLRYDSGTIQVVDLERVSQVVDAWRDSRTQAADCTPDLDRPEILDCDESGAAGLLIGGAAVRTGNFASSVAVQDLGGGDLRLLVPVRGDPSITWIDWSAADRRLSCSGEQGFVLCDDQHRLTRMRGDEELPPIQTEPYGVYVDSVSQYAMVTHFTSGTVTLVDSPPGGPPVLADAIAGLFALDAQTGARGASGLAGRSPGPGNIVYVQSRTEPRVQMLGVIRPDGDYPFLVPTNHFFLDGVGGTSGGISEDSRGVVFDATGDTAYMINRSPPSLQVYDTSVDATGVPVNRLITATDLCRQATSIAIADTGTGQRAYVTCYQNGQVYAIDPRPPARVESVITVGRGPFTLAAVPDRQLLFVTNFLENSVIVIDLDPTSSTYHRVVLRIGVRS